MHIEVIEEVKAILIEATGSEEIKIGVAETSMDSM
jgi:hypothetical protein